MSEQGLETIETTTQMQQWIARIAESIDALRRDMQTILPAFASTA